MNIHLSILFHASSFFLQLNLRRNLMNKINFILCNIKMWHCLHIINQNNNLIKQIMRKGTVLYFTKSLNFCFLKIIGNERYSMNKELVSYIFFKEIHIPEDCQHDLLY